MRFASFINLFYIVDILSGPLFGHIIAPKNAPPSQIVAWPEMTAFVDVTVIPMDVERVLLKQTVLVKDGWIVALGPANQVKVPATAIRIDGRGKYLIPGLADMHTHLIAFGAGDSAAVEQRLFHYLAYGVTTVRNMDYSNGKDGEKALRLRARAARGELWSPRIYTSGKLWGNHPIRPGAPPESVAVYVAAYKAAGYDFIKVYQESSTVRDSLLDVARRLGIPVAGHVRELGPKSIEESYAAIQDRFASIEHLTAYLHSDASLTPLDTFQMRSLAVATQQANVWNDPTLAVHAATGGFFQNVPARLQMVKALQTAGAGLLLGSDATGLTPSLQPGAATHTELQALVAAGLTPYQALLTGTRNVATFFGTLDSTGTVAVGKRADLVLLDGNPLDNIRNTSRSAGVMINGRWLGRAELDQHLAVQVTSSAQRRSSISWWKYVPSPGPRSQDKVLNWNDLYWSYVMETAAERAHRVLQKIILTEAQKRSFQESLAAQGPRRQALVDSLEVNDHESSGHSRVIRLISRQFDEVRSFLTSEQRSVFDSQVREWRVWYGQQYYQPISNRSFGPSIRSP